MKSIFTKRNLFLIIPMILFSIMLAIFLIFGISKVDDYILKAFENMRNPVLTTVVLIITNLCSPYVLLIIIFLLLIIFKNKKFGLFLSLDVFFGVVINQIIKFIVARQRPVGYMLIDETGYSFPSAHSMISMIFYGFLMYILYVNIKSKKLKKSLVVLMSILIILIALTRVYLGVHYPSDILAGLALGYIHLIFYVNIVKKYMFKID